MTPTTGDRWSLPGYDDIIVIAVSGDTVSFTQDTRSFTISHLHFHNLATESLKRGATMNSALEARISANLENITEDSEV